MTKKEIEEKRDALKEKFKGFIKNLDGDAKASFELIQSELEAVYSSMESKETNNEAVKALEGKISGLEKSITELSEKEVPISLKDLENIKDELLKIKSKMEKGVVSAKTLREFLGENKEKLLEIKSTRSTEFEMKAADIITTTGNVAPQPNPYLPAPTVFPNINPVVTPSQRILDYVSRGTVSSPAVVLINEVNGDGDAEWVPEGGLKPLMDFEHMCFQGKK